MYKITGKQRFGAVWVDGECIATFNRGVAETNDTVKADVLRGMGYTVEGAPDQVESPAADPFAKMSKDELKNYAAEHGIDLTDVPDKKADLLKAIKETEAEQ